MDQRLEKLEQCQKEMQDRLQLQVQERLDKMKQEMSEKMQESQEDIVAKLTQLERMKEELPKQLEEMCKWLEEKFRAMEVTKSYRGIDAKELSLEWEDRYGKISLEEEGERGEQHEHVQQGLLEVQKIHYPIMIEDGGTAMYEGVVRNLHIDAIFADTFKRILVRYSP
ncbi:uncharacterized protein LOC128040495 [Gossypium raimondii]|uniref:uncharacterized protein LOC128040495 n=1 Tax=Gossypium raimondii TaxID=29730 RepID=UPI00227CC5C4|nr:uncharacterized protein LOC128040495 [Gossypium raimondii]